MTTDMMMRVKDQILIVLADYQSCKRDEIDERLDLNFEQESNRIAAEVAKRVMSNYAILTNRKKVMPFMTLAQAAIEVYVLEQAKLKHDPWVLSRDEGSRIRAAYDISRIIDARAGKVHKFSVWSGSILGVAGHGNRGVPCIVAAPSAKAAVDYLNAAIPHARETLSWFREHWSGGGHTGNKLATKPGVWLGKKKGNTDVVGDYELIWEPK